MGWITQKILEVKVDVLFYLP